jgi:hypothetical protein
MQIVKMWTDSVMSLIPGVCVPNMPPGMTRGGSPCATVSVQTVYDGPALVSVSLDPYVQHLKLTVDPVKHEDKADKEVTAHIDNHHGRFVVTIEVPDDRPLGTYRAAIRDLAKAKRGELTVELLKAHKR